MATATRFIGAPTARHWRSTGWRRTLLPGITSRFSIWSRYSSPTGKETIGASTSTPTAIGTSTATRSPASPSPTACAPQVGDEPAGGIIAGAPAGRGLGPAQPQQKPRSEPALNRVYG